MQVLTAVPSNPSRFMIFTVISVFSVFHFQMCQGVPRRGLTGEGLWELFWKVSPGKCFPHEEYENLPGTSIRTPPLLLGWH